MKLLTDQARAMLRQRRLERGIRQDHLAAEIGVTPVTLCRLEVDEYQPSIDTLARWCTALGLSLSVDIQPQRAAASR